MKRILALGMAMCMFAGSVFAVDTNSSASNTSQSGNWQVEKKEEQKRIPIKADISLGYENGGAVSVHTVVSGDTLKDIAAKYGMTLEEVVKLNPHIKNINLILVGQKIQVKPGDSAAERLPEPKESDKKEGGSAVFPEVRYVSGEKNGTYRGVFVDGDVQQVGLQFSLKDGRMDAIKYRVLYYKGTDYLKAEGEREKALLAQYNALIEGLKGLTVEEAVEKIGTPATYVKDAKVGDDTLSSATLRFPKMRAALRDALNKGLYAQPKRSFDDGVYRGQFIDGGIEQVGVQFEIKDGVVANARFRSLAYRGANYLDEKATVKQKHIAKQYQQALDLMVGKEVGKVLGAYDYPAVFVENQGTGEDAVTGATLRLNKLKVAVQDALNKGVYSVKGDVMPSTDRYKNVENGNYRGVFTDRNNQQVGVRFTVENGKFSKVTFSLLKYKGVDYLKTEDAKGKALKLQYEELIEHLVGKDVATVQDLYKPGNVAKDVKVDTDTMTGATLRSSKVISAIHDALLKGVYNK